MVEGQWKFVSVCSERGDDVFARCDVPVDIQDAILADLLDLAQSPRGPARLNSIVHHQINPDPKVMQISVGRWRVLYHQAEGQLLIVLECFLKQSKKTPDPVKNSAIKKVKNFKQDFDNNLLEYID